MAVVAVVVMAVIVAVITVIITKIVRQIIRKEKKNIENNKTYPPCYSFDTAEGIITSTPEVLSFAHLFG